MAETRRRQGLTGIDTGTHHSTGFEAFWSLYPRQQERDAALRAWQSVRPTSEVAAQIVTAVALQRTWPHWQAGGPRVPKPANWLRGHRWKDRAPDGSGVN